MLHTITVKCVQSTLTKEQPEKKVRKKRLKLADKYTDNVSTFLLEQLSSKKELDYYILQFIDEVKERLTLAEKLIVEQELAFLSKQVSSGDALTDARSIAKSIPERVSTNTKDVLIRMHELAETGTLASNLSSFFIVQSLYNMGLVGYDRHRTDVDVFVGRGHIAPVFYAEEYVRGNLPFALLATLHRAFPGVVQKKWGFLNTMGYSLGIGLAQAVSKAWSLKQDQKPGRVIGFAGDGELHEGITYECLKFACDRNLNNFTLIVDANGKGIEDLACPLQAKTLSAFFSSAIEVDGCNIKAISDAINFSLECLHSTAIICRTKKGPHSFKLPGKNSGKQKYSTKVGKIINEFIIKQDVTAKILTADMAGRFGLKGYVPYTNVSLAETLSVGLTLELSKTVLKIVCTDAKYYLDSLGTISDACTMVEHLVLMAGKSWGQWGGAAHALNMLAMVPNIEAFEPITEKELTACFQYGLTYPQKTLVVSTVDADTGFVPNNCAENIHDGVCITKPVASRPLILSFGYATSLVIEANAELNLAHIHCMALKPIFTPDTLSHITNASRILIVEYNQINGGFAEFVRSQYGIRGNVVGIKNSVNPCSKKEQLRRHQMDYKTLKNTLYVFKEAKAELYVL